MPLGALQKVSFAYLSGSVFAGNGASRVRHSSSSNDQDDGTCSRVEELQKRLMSTITTMQVEDKAIMVHYVNNKTFYTYGTGEPKYPTNAEHIILGMGCFWCSENLWMKIPEAQGVYSTSVGYYGGVTRMPTYEEVSAKGNVSDNHAEVVKIVYDKNVLSLKDILVKYWEHHDPTKLNQQGNDRGTQYRSCIFWFTDEQYIFSLTN